MEQFVGSRIRHSDDTFLIDDDHSINDGIEDGFQMYIDIFLVGMTVGSFHSMVEALKYLNQHKGKLFDNQLVALFIKMIGVFPVGSIVELSNGEIGIVITSNRDDNLRPKVLLMLDANKMPMERRIVNLARRAVDFLGRPIKITKTLRKGDYGIDQQQLIQEGVQFTVLN